MIGLRKKISTLLCVAALLIQSLGFYRNALPQISEKAQENAPAVWLNELPNEIKLIPARQPFQSIGAFTKYAKNFQQAIAHPSNGESSKYSFYTNQPAHSPFITVKHPVSQFTADR
jgi:hypothetical protein